MDNISSFQFLRLLGELPQSAPMLEAISVPVLMLYFNMIQHTTCWPGEIAALALEWIDDTPHNPYKDDDYYDPYD